MAKRKKYNATANVGKVHVEDVTTRMKKPCDGCGNRIEEDVRLVHVTGAGKWQKQEVFCVRCGIEEVNTLSEKLEDIRSTLYAHE